MTVPLAQSLLEMVAAGAGIALVVTAVATIFGLLIYQSIRNGKAWKARLAAVAEHYGLFHDAGSWLKAAKSTGSVGSSSLTFDSYTVSTGKSSTTYSRITLSTQLPQGLKIKKEGILSGLAQALLGQDVQAGLTAFDDNFVLDGIDELEVLAFLDSRTRQAIWAAIGREGATLSKSEISYAQVGYMKTTEEMIRKADAMLELAQALEQSRGVRTPARLLQHAFEDPAPSFRARCFEALVRRRPRSSEAATALERGKTSEDAALRFLCTVESENPDEDLVADLVRSGQLPDHLKAEGLAMLGSRFAGGLSVEPVGETGGLSVSTAQEGGLSEARASEPRRQPKKQRQ